MVEYKNIVVEYKNINELSKALSEVQKELHGAKATAKNPFFKSTYADLGDVWESIREPLTKNGFSVSQLGVLIDGLTFLKTVLLHSSGQCLESLTPILHKKDDAQSFGSGMSYSRRYALAAIVGVYQVDDDANAAVGQGATQEGVNVSPGSAHGLIKAVTPIAKHNDPRSFEDHALLSPGDFIVPFGKEHQKGKKIKELPTREIAGAMGWAKSKGKFEEFIKAAEAYLSAPKPPQDDGPPLESYEDEIPF